MSSGPVNNGDTSGWLDRLAAYFQRDPDTRDELLAILRTAGERDLLDRDSLDTIERVIHVSELRVRDVMLPRSQMVVVERDASPEDILPVVVESAHSRFPVINGDRDRIVGILLAKDLLRYFSGDAETFQMRDVLREAVFIPESKRLNILLSEFRANRNHMAIVVDEYNGVAGLITIEDVLEQIVGEIEDEHDVDEEEAMIMERGSEGYIIKALLPLEDFNEHFGTSYPVNEIDTIGGLVISRMGKVPERGERIRLDRCEFEVVNADSRRVHLLKMRLR